MKNDLILVNRIETEDYLRLRKEVGWKEMEPESAREALDNSTFCVSAKIGSEPVGIARMIGDGVCRGLITDVIVSEKFQGKGFGKTLIKHLLSETQKLVNKSGVQFMIELLPMAGKAEFYVKCGFKHKPDVMDGCYIWIKKEI